MKNERVFREILILGIIALVALLSARFHFRLDLSREGSYTLSPYSREVLAELDSSMTVTWYRSAALQQFAPTVRYIEDFLEEYRQASDGNFSFRVIDPVTAGKTGTAADLGIVSRQIEIRESGGSSVKDLWSGLLVEYRGEHRVIPFLLDTETLEYDLTRLVLELESTGEEKRNADALQIVYGNREEYSYVAPWVSYAGFTPEILRLPVTGLDPSKSLLVIGSADIDSVTAAAMDAFLSSGGNAAFFVSGNTVSLAGDWKAVPKKNDAILALLESRGMRVESPLVMDVSNFRITMPSLDDTRLEYINYPFWVKALQGGMKSGHPLLSGVRELQFYWPSEIFIGAGSGAESLVETSASAILMDEPYDTNPFGKQMTLFSSGRQGGPKRLAAADTEKGRLLLVADEYLPGAMVEYTASDANLDFLVNCVEWISGKDRLLALKSRKPASLAAPQADAGAVAVGLNAARAINLVAIPALICLIFATVTVRRNKRR